MASKRSSEWRTQLLRRLQRRKIERFRFIGMDAFVARVRDSVPYPPLVQEMIQRCPCCRLYPVKGGYLVKWPYSGDRLPSTDFWIEPGGWDHEHCDACHRTIKVGDTAWLTVRGTPHQLCLHCYRRVVQLRSDNHSF